MAISPGFGMVTEFLAARIIKNCEKIFETMASRQGGSDGMLDGV
jgi:hypothetical protein